MRKTHPEPVVSVPGFIKANRTSGRKTEGVFVRVRPTMVWVSGDLSKVIQDNGGAYDVMLNSALGQVLVVAHSGGGLKVTNPGTTNSSLKGALAAFVSVGVTGFCPGEVQGNTILFQGPVNNHE